VEVAVISIERSFFERFPRLAQGPARGFAQPVVALLRRIACEERINATLREIGALGGFAFVERVLETLDVDYSVANTDRENIPVEGRAIIVANHPLGALDALALIHLVGSVRRDVKVLANDMLLQFAQLAPLLLPLPVFGSGSAVRGLRHACRALEDEQALIVFPAGEVSRVRADGIRDGAWAPGFVRLARKAGAPVLPVHIAAQNSPVFYGVSMLARPLASVPPDSPPTRRRMRPLILVAGAPNFSRAASWRRKTPKSDGTESKPHVKIRRAPEAMAASW